MPEKLESLARARYPVLTQAEVRLLQAAPLGHLAVCGPNDDKDPSNDPAKAADWGRDREIRADLIRWLCLDPAAASLIDPRGIQIYAARVAGALDLSLVVVAFPLLFFRCCLSDPADMTQVQIPLLSFQGSWTGPITADRVKVAGGVHLRGGFTAKGGVRLNGAQIGDDLDCQGGTFKNPNKVALSADGVNVTGNLFLSHGFSADGEVWLLGAQIGGDLECVDGTFKNPSDDALSADGARVMGRVLLRGLSAEGNVRLVRAQIGSDLDCKGGTFKAKLDLRNASAGALVDDEKSWPASGNLELDGFVYARISDRPPDAESRLRWLSLQKQFTPQPYRQLAKVLAATGDEKGAKKVLIDMEQREREGQWILNPAFRWTVGYGYDPLRAFWWLGGLSALGWLIFWRAKRLKAMAPTDGEAYKLNKENAPLAQYTRFSPLLYTVENLFPLVKFGQADKWQPDPEFHSPPRRPGNWWTALLDRLASRPGFLRAFVVFLVFAGWFLAVLFAAGVTGMLRKP